MITAAIKASPRRADNVFVNEISKQMPHIDSHGIVHACAWCYPGANLVAAFPEFSGLKVSHGMCKPHMKAMMADYLANEVKMTR